MKLFFAEAHAIRKIKIPKKILSTIPNKICLATDVQFIKQIPDLKIQLEAAEKLVSLLMGAHAKHASQILGCSHIKLDYPKEIEAFLYIGDGLFHPKALLLGSDKPVYIFNPFSEEFRLLKRAEADRMIRHERAATAKFLHSENIGVLLTVKPGQLGVQAHLKQIMDLSKEYPDKKFHYLAFDTLDFTQLENFPFVDCFVNTACTRLIDDYSKFPKPLVNLDTLLKLKK